MSNLRLVYAEPKPIITPLDVQRALQDWRAINSSPHRWATFQAGECASMVEWGYILSGGVKDSTIQQTILYILQEDGSVKVTCC